MSKSTRTPVSAKTIRTAFQTGALDAAKVVDAKGKPVTPLSVLGRDGDASRVRGRVNPAFVTAFLEANPGSTYAEKSQAESPMVEVPLVSPKTGRPVKPVTLPRAEVRSLAGIEGRRGRIAKSDLAAAGVAFQVKRTSKSAAPVE
jgi:hypothetical protein